MIKHLFIFSLFLSITFSFAKGNDVTAQQVFANIEWATKNGIVLEKIENVSFVDKAGTQKTGILEIIKQEDGTLGVRVVNGTIALLEKVDKRKVYDLLNDIEKSTDLQDFVKAGKDFTKEWQILESYPSFRVQGTFVNKITTILSKGHISEVDFTTILSVNKGLGKRATDLANFLEDLDHFALYQDRDGFGSIISGLKANWFNGAGADGANWVIAVLRKEGITVFDPAKTNFEVVENILGETRRYDAIVGQRGSGTEKYFEFKSYNKVPPTDFAKQFINDLNNANITDLKQLEWLFDAAKNPADFINNMKNAIRNLDEDLIDQATVTKFGVQSKGDVKAKVLNSFDTVFKLK